MTKTEIFKLEFYIFSRRGKNSIVCYYKGDLLRMSDLVEHCSFWYDALFSRVVLDSNVRILSKPYYQGLLYRHLKFLLMVLINDYCEYTGKIKPFPYSYVHSFKSLLPYSWLKYDEDFTEDDLISVAFAI